MSPPDQTQQQAEQALLSLLSQLLEELNPNTSHAPYIHLDAKLDTDLGLDSLSRVELTSRVESHFSVALPGTTFAQAETPRAILEAVLAAPNLPAELSLTASFTSQPRVESTPHGAATLVEALQWHVENHPERTHLVLLDDEHQPQNLSYRALYTGATKVASHLRDQGLNMADTVAIMLPTGLDYFYSFFGILIAGGVPVPIYPPVRLSQLEDHLLRHTHILNNCQAKFLITIPKAKPVAHLLKAQVPLLLSIHTPEELQTASPLQQGPALRSSDTAFLQYTSGSTGQPKGVVLTHANLLANIRAMGEAAQVSSEDVFVSWLPLYHDMGLIGAWLGSLYFAMTFVVMSPLSFLARPERWLRAIHHYHGTLSAAPNFGYELCLKRLNASKLEGLNLRSWRAAFNGAEAISAKTLNEFCKQFEHCGFARSSMKPVYGLAENSVGLAFPSMSAPPRVDRVNRTAFSRSGLAKPDDSPQALEFISCGSPIPHNQIRIMDGNNRELPERREGQVEFISNSATCGYFQAPGKTQGLFNGNWLRTGDLGYVANGELFITGRVKDVVIRGGRNIYPHELEQAIGELNSVRTGRVVAFGTLDKQKATEKLVVIAETHEPSESVKATLVQQINALSVNLIGMPIDDVVLSSPGTILKTSSGKVRRAACKELYEKGTLNRGKKSLSWQLTRLGLSSLRPQAHRLLQRFSEALFAGYAWFMGALLGLLALLSALLLPVFSWRWRLMQAAARLLGRLTATRVTVSGLDNVELNKPCLYVANHASYLDAIVLAAVLPGHYHFIAKAELQNNIWIHSALKRLQVTFVERFDIQQSSIESERMVELLAQGEQLVIFPQGTFFRASGLTDFHLGGYLAAAKAKVPVIPIAIRGTRSMLRAKSWFPRYGEISVTLGQPIAPKPSLGEWQQALKLKELSYDFILKHCGEPALSGKPYVE